MCGNDQFQSDEPERFLTMCKVWLQQLASFKRVIFNTTISIEGKTTFICRYICKQKPPVGIDSIQKISRFVSMIPFIPNRTAFAAECMIWCTSDQMVEIGAADFAEHAILLCNYLLYLGLDAFVILGRGIPEGMVSYVMVRDEINASFTNFPEFSNKKDLANQIQRSSPQNLVIYNPVTGDSYKIYDTHIPLKEIGCIFNS